MLFHIQEGVKPRQSTWTWTRCQMSLERRAVMLCSDMRSAVVRSTIYSCPRQVILLTLSHLSLMFRLTPLEPRTSKKSVSLLDMDVVCNSSSSSSTVISPRVADQLKDLLTFDQGLMIQDEMVEREEERESRDEHKTLDGMIQANLAYFEGVGSSVLPDRSLGVIKRR